MKLKQVIVLVTVLCSSSLARESKIMNYLGNFIPSLTEIATITNCANIYEKVSQFVRTTSKLVHSVSQAQSDWDRLRYNVTQIYEDIKYLKDIDPYNMDTWQSSLQNCSFSLKLNKSQAVDAFNMLEAHTLGASTTYIQKIQTISDYNNDIANKRKAINSMYNNPQYSSELAKASDAIRGYRLNTIAQLRSIQSADLLVIQNSKDPTAIAQAQTHFDQVDASIKDLETTTASSVQMEKPDSIIDQTSNLIAINLTEIKCSSDRIVEMEKSAASLAAAYYRLLGQNVNSQKSGGQIASLSIPIDPTPYDPSNPDKVSAPVQPTFPAAPNEEPKKNVCNQDILNLYNAASFLSLKQESLKRDILAMKVNTMAFIVTMEAMRRNKAELSSIALAHQSRMMDIGMGAAK